VRLDEDKFNLFLLRDWNKAKSSQLIFHKRLSGFFKDRFPQIRLASELEKDLHIRNLAKSGSFAKTHGVIAQLSRYTDYSDTQLNDIVDAVISNNQVCNIADDADVKEFLCKLISGRESKIDLNKLKCLKNYMYFSLSRSQSSPTIEIDDDSDIPF